MGVNERFVAGRLRRRVLRGPVIEGWLCEERNVRPPERVALRLVKRDDAFGLEVPDQRDLAKLDANAARLLADGDDWEVTIGWPEQLVILRRGGVVVHASGDPIHFGPLQLDPAHSVRRSGYEYLGPDSPEVSVELELDTGEEVRAEMLGPGATTRHGPYTIAHDRSFDPSDRPTSLKHHGYMLTITRAGAPPGGQARTPHPLDVTAPAEVLAAARDAGALASSEGYLAEPNKFTERLELYEGGRNQLEEAARNAGPAPATFRRLADSVEVVTIGVRRDESGHAQICRATITLPPTGPLRVIREPLDALPGRLRTTKTPPLTR